MSRTFVSYAGAAVAAYFGYWNYAAALLTSGIASEKQRRARNQARDAYNASLQDRMAMLDLRPDSPRTIALGRVRAVEGVRRRWASGANNEKLTLIVSFAGHEIDGFEQFWFNDVPLSLDVDGYVQKPANLTGCSATASGTTATLTKTSHGRTNGEKVVISGFDVARFNGTFVVSAATANTFQYTIPNSPGGNPSTASGVVEMITPYVRSDSRTDNLTDTADGSGNATVTLTSSPISGTVTAVYTYGTGDAQIQGECVITQDTGLVYDVTGAIAGSTIAVTWQTAFTESSARVRSYLGTSTQNVGNDLAAEYPGKLTTTDAFKGIALAVIDLNYSEDAFPQGIPNITATFRGAKCLDPRDSSTAWTENPAIHAYHYARLATGWNVPDAEIRSQDFEDAADFCDTSTLFTLGADDVTLERYRCGIVLSSDADPRQNMNAIMETMAGRWGWAGGTLRMRCGRMATPAWSLDESWIAQPISNGGQTSDQPVVRITNGVPREEKVNHVSGTCVDPDQRYQALPYPTVRDEVLITAEGAEYRLDANLLGVNHIAHAQHLASITIREGQAPLRMEITSNMLGYPLELFDVGEVTVDRYGMVAKTFEVIGWRWRPTEGVALRLSEITEAMFEPVDTLNGRDPAPNGNLPSPWNVEKITGVAVDAGASLQSDGTVLTISTVTWDAVISQAVLVGGRIEVQFVRVDSVPATGDWTSWIEQGGSLSAVITGLTAGLFYLFRVRAINSLGVRGPWSDQVLHGVDGDASPPDDVTNFAYTIKPGQVALTWDPCTNSDYSVTEIRIGASWVAGVFGWAGKASERNVARPPNGTYLLWAKHVDNTGNYSTNAVSLSVTVDDSIDGGGGALLLLSATGAVFIFADGTTHTSATPDITFTANLIGTTGTATWAAVAYNAANASLGAVTLGGTTINQRTLSAAQFVAPGTSGSVRYVVVTASFPGVPDDSITVLRYDPTVTAPLLYLTNEVVAVATDEAGEYGDWSRATTGVIVFEAGADDTANWTITATPDAGLTATINGGAGPVTAATVTLAASASTIDDAYVSLSATKGATTITGSWRVYKSKASGSGYTAFFNPDQIDLDVDSNGDVLSYTNAFSDFSIIKGGSQDDTAQWTLTKVDSNVTSSLSGKRVTVSAFLGLGDIGTPTSVTISRVGTGWDRINTVIRGSNEWIMLGHATSGTWQYVKRSTDFITWTDVDVGLAARWGIGAYDEATNAYVLIETGTGSTNKTRRSTDGGLNWSGSVTLPISTQWEYIVSGGGKMIATSVTSATAAYSTNGGSSWSSYTYPASSMSVYPGAGAVWISRDGSDVTRKSLDSGATWSTVSGLPLAVNSAIGFQGRTVLTFRYTSTDKAAVSSDYGATFQIVTLPYYYTNGVPVVISGVLYLFGTKVMYTVDGLTWKSIGDTPPSVTLLPSSVELNLTYVPGLDISVDKAYKTPLLSTSATRGSVTLTARKANELDIVRVLPVNKGRSSRDSYIVTAVPGTLILPSTSDGVVTSFAAATITAAISSNGVDDTTNWTWTWATSNAGLTPTTGTTNIATITGMTTALATATVIFTASKAGQPEVRGGIVVGKSYGGDISGVQVGAAFNLYSDTATYIAMRFTPDGWVQVKEGSGGSFVNAQPYFLPVGTNVAASRYIKVLVRSGTLTSGSTGSYLQLNANRDYVLSDATSGTHFVELDIVVATNSSGANAQRAVGSLMLIVP